jgi:squalene-associated FAD-dependent desaturase
VSARRIAVIGGGLAGLTAALDCAASGAHVTLLESRGRLGGAAYSFERDGFEVDNGQHVFLRCCTEYRALLGQLRVTDGVILQPRLELAVLAPGGRRGWLRRAALPAPLHLAPALLRYPFLPLRERLSVAAAMQRLRSIDPDDPSTDGRSFGEWLRANGQSPRAVEAVWGLIARPTLNLVPDDASLAQAAQVFQLGLLQVASAGDVGYARVPLSRLHDSAARAALVRAGVEVRLRSGATAIHSDADGFSIEISGAPSVAADGVVLAVQPDRAAKLVPARAGVRVRDLVKLGSSPIVNLHVVYDRPVLDVPFAAGIDGPVQWMFDRTSSSGIGSGQYLAVSLSAADSELAETSEDLRAKYVDAIAALLPAARRATVRTFFVTREHAATFRAAPGARRWRPQARTELPGFVLAGAWTDTGWPATMEGAVRSGHAAAWAVLSSHAEAQSSAPARPNVSRQLAGLHP